MVSETSLPSSRALNRGQTTFSIEVATEEEVKAIALWQRMREFNRSKIGNYTAGVTVWLNAKDAEGNFAGGFRGEIYFDWLIVYLLFVEEPYRRKGIGSRLLAEGEEHGRRKGARRARLDTFDWQAPEFYSRQGYRELLKIPDYFSGRALFFMTKDL